MRRVSRLVALPVAFAILFVTAAQAQQTRPFLMSSTAIQTVQTPGQIYQNYSAGFPFSALAADVDVITVFPEYLGIPLASFAGGTAPPPTDPWTVQMLTMAHDARATGKPLMVQIALSRVNVVPMAINNFGTLQLVSNWAPGCLDFTNPLYAGLSAAYVNYATWIAGVFAPKYLVTMVEPNLYYASCGGNTASWKAFAAIGDAVYDAVKHVDASIVAFPSYNLEALYSQNLTGYDAAQYTNAVAAMKHDRLGFATFPWGLGNPYQLPLDYFTRVRDKNPSEPRIVIAETGWNSTTIRLYWALFNTCSDFLYNDPSFESAFMSFLIYSAYVGNFDVITWWSDRDLIDSKVLGTCYPPATPPFFTQCNGDFWCIGVNFDRAYPPPWTPPEFGELVYKAFGAMGLRNYDGSPKTGQLDLWKKYLALPQS